MTNRIRVNPEKPDLKHIKLAVSILNEGGTVVYPTDTLYGLGADATNINAVRKVFEIKGRAYSQPLPVLISSIEMLEMFADEVPMSARKLAEKFWAGALTIIVRAEKFSHLGSSNVGFRVPAHKVPIEIIRLLGKPIVGTSANISTMQGANDPDEIEYQLGNRVDLILDCGRLPQSIPSTVIDVTGHPPKLVRAGAIKIDEIEKFLNINLKR